MLKTAMPTPSSHFSGQKPVVLFIFRWGFLNPHSVYAYVCYMHRLGVFVCVCYLLNVIQVHFLNTNKKGRCWNSVVSFTLPATLLSSSQMPSPCPPHHAMCSIYWFINLFIILKNSPILISSAHVCMGHLLEHGQSPKSHPLEENWPFLPQPPSTANGSSAGGRRLELLAHLCWLILYTRQWQLVWVPGTFVLRCPEVSYFLLAKTKWDFRHPSLAYARSSSRVWFYSLVRFLSFLVCGLQFIGLSRAWGNNLSSG